MNETGKDDARLVVLNAMDAAARGVEVGCYRANVTRKGIELAERLVVDLSN